MPRYRRRRRRQLTQVAGGVVHPAHTILPHAAEEGPGIRSCATEPILSGVASVSKKASPTTQLQEESFPERTISPRCRGRSRCWPLCNRANSVQAWHRYRRRRRRSRKSQEDSFPERRILPHCRGGSRCSLLCNQANSDQGWRRYRRRRRRPRNWPEESFPERRILPRCRGGSRCWRLCNRASSVQGWRRYRRRPGRNACGWGNRVVSVCCRPPTIPIGGRPDKRKAGLPLRCPL